MADGATPASGYTTQGQQTQNLINAINTLSTAGGSYSPQVQSAMGTLSGAQGQMAANQGTNMQAATQNMVQQSGIPQLQGQQQGLMPAFQMYLADSQLAQNYMNQTNPNIYANAGVTQSAQGNPMANLPGFQTTMTNPYLASADSIVNAVTPPPSSGFSGFSNPQSAIAASTGPVNATINFLNALNSAIYSQQGLVNQGMNTYSQNYQGTMNMLGNAFGALQNYGMYQGNAVNIPGTKQNAASIYQTLKDTFVGNMQSVGKVPTWDGFYYYLNSQKNALNGQGVDIGELYNLQGMDRKEFGGNSDMQSGAKITSAATKQAQAVNNGVQAVKNFGDLMKNYKTGYTNLGSIPGIGNIEIPKDINAVNEYGSQLNTYLGQVTKLLGMSRSNPSFLRLQEHLPGTTIGLGTEGGLRGHLENLLNTTGLDLVRDNKTGKYGITPVTAFDPNTETKLDVTTEPIDKIITILQGL